MRHLILTLAILCLTGCGPGPKSAKGNDKPEPAKETYTATLKRVDASIAGMSETVGNTNNELSGIKSELQALKLTVDSLEGQVDDIHKLLSADAELSVEVPQAADICVPQSPPTPAAVVQIPLANPGPTLNGKPLNVAATIQANYRRRWSHPGSIDTHLAEHGVAGFQGLDNETKERLHSALHEMGQTPVKAVAKERTVYRAPVVLPQNCPNGKCPSGVTYGYQPRQRLFGRWR